MIQIFNQTTYHRISGSDLIYWPYEAFQTNKLFHFEDPLVLTYYLHFFIVMYV